MHIHMVDRKTAKQAGLRRFFNGKPCVRGVIWERRVKGRCDCVKCLEMARQSDAATYALKKEKILARRKIYYAENRERLLAEMRSYYEKHKDALGDKSSARWRDYGKSERKTDPKKIASHRESLRKYYLANKPLHRSIGAKRRAAKTRSVPSWFSDLDAFIIKEAYSLVRLRRKHAGGDWHVDHMIPLQCGIASGLHCGANIQVIPSVVNLSKGNNMVMTEPFQWISYL